MQDTTLSLHLGQVSYDQLPLNPPGLEDSKGMRLSGAIRIACPFFYALDLESKNGLTKHFNDEPNQKEIYYEDFNRK